MLLLIVMCRSFPSWSPKVFEQWLNSCNSMQPDTIWICCDPQHQIFKLSSRKSSPLLMPITSSTCQIIHNSCWTWLQSTDWHSLLMRYEYLVAKFIQHRATCYLLTMLVRKITTWGHQDAKYNKGTGWMKVRGASMLLQRSSRDRILATPCEGHI